MAYDVRVEEVVARDLAGIRTTTTAAQLSTNIIRLLDEIWPVLREAGVGTGHNVVVYNRSDGDMIVDVGVEVFTPFSGRGDIHHVATPSGQVATTTHFGEYSAMAPAWAALKSWCAENGCRWTGTGWEVYGDWADDPAERRTDIYFQLT